MKPKRLSWLLSMIALLAVPLYIRSCNRQHYRPNDFDIAFDLSPKGDQIVFTGAGRGVRDLFVLNLKTWKVVQLTNTLDYEGDPAFSPDGQSIVYAAGTGDRADHLFLRSISGTSVKQLTNEDFNDREPAFSPDGKSIVFVRDHQYVTGGMAAWGSWRYSQLYTIKADGTQIQKLSDGDVHHVDSPNFSPDGRAIIFDFGHVASYGRTEDIGEVKYNSASPQKARQLTRDGHSSFPAISPDGKHIIFVSDPSGHGYGLYYRLFLMNRDGTGRRQIMEDPVAVKPAISPNGKSIYFISHSTSSNSGSTVNGLWRVNMDGTNLAQIADSTLFRHPLVMENDTMK